MASARQVKSTRCGERHDVGPAPQSVASPDEMDILSTTLTLLLLLLVVLVCVEDRRGEQETERKKKGRVRVKDSMRRMIGRRRISSAIYLAAL